MEAIAALILLGALAYFWTEYGKEFRKRFWMWITEKSPYYKVATNISLTSKALKKYTNEALIRKLMELEAQNRALESKLKEIESKITAQKEFKEEVENQENEKIKEVLNLDPILKPLDPIKVYDADGVFRGYLDSIRGTFSEAYILVRTKDNELLIFGPDELTNMLLNETSFADQIRNGILMIAYDRYNRKVSPAYVRVHI